MKHFVKINPLRIRAVVASIFVAFGTLMGSAGLADATQPNLPNLGDGTDMTPSAERRLGDRIVRELYRDPDYVDDAILGEYVQGIWQPLLAAARDRGELAPELDETYAWTVLLGRDRSVNAFALPGAYFGLHLGLVGVVTSCDELASVLAHELSHVTQRHIARNMARQSQQAPWLMGAMILGMLAAAKDPNAASAVLVGGQAAGIQSQLNFSRDMEREADRIGFNVATHAGFAPQGFVSMFAKLQQASRLNDSGSFPYLRSHPLSTERMADMQSRIELPDAAAPATQSRPRQNVLEMDHGMMSARARVLSNSSADGLRSWAAEAEASSLARLTPAQQAATLYGASLAAIKLREFAQANRYWQALVQRVRGDAASERLARLLGVELMLAGGDGGKALELLGRPKGGGGASSRAELLLRAQAVLIAQNAATLLASAREELQTWVAMYPKDAQAWGALASIQAAQGHTLSSIRSQAEVAAAEFDFPAALSRFKAAQDWARKEGSATDHVEASIVDTRARQVESTIREQALER